MLMEFLPKSSSPNRHDREGRIAGSSIGSENDPLVNNSLGIK